jgi:biopolymer transport protein ExbD
MGGISVGDEGGGGKKSVNSEIPLIPFIDLLLCCVMFLLVTAVWNQLARINANQQQPGEQQPVDQLEQKIKMILQVQNTGYVIASTAGDRFEIPKVGEDYDVEALREKLQERKRLEPNRRDFIVAPEDGVAYSHVVEAMDTVVGEGFPDMTLSDGSTL